MKKLRVVILLAAALTTILLMTGCGQKAEEADKNQSAKLKVALAIDEVGLGDGGFNDAANNGLVKAQKEFGDAIETAVVELPSKEPEKELRTLAKNKTDLIIALGVYCSEPMAKVAKEYPDTKFVLLDTRLPNLKADGNITCVTFKDNEGSFLAGAAAASKTQTGRIGFVGGADIPVVNNFETGFTAGARYIDPDVIVISNYVATGIEGFNDPAKARTLALNQMSYGVDVIYQATGGSGSGVFDAAAAQKKLVIGTDIDQTFSVPEAQRPYILTSIIKGIDGAVCDVIRQQSEKRLQGGYIELGIKDGVQTYAENDINKNMLSDIRPKLDYIKTKIINGDITVPKSDDRPNF